MAKLKTENVQDKKTRKSMWIHTMVTVMRKTAVNSL